MENNIVNVETEQISAPKKSKKGIIIAAISVVLAVVIGVLAYFLLSPMLKYNKALELIDDEEYKEAHKILTELGGYKDSEELCDNFVVKYKKSITKTADSTNTFIMEYDEYGNCTRSEGSSNGETMLVLTFVNKYDEDNNLLSVTTSLSYPGMLGNYLNDSSSFVVYDKKGNIINDNGTVYICDYDENENLVCKYTADKSEKFEYEYDRDGNISKETWYEYGEMTCCYEYEYDKYGNESKEIRYNSYGFVETKTENEYDKYGNIQKSRRYSDDGSVLAEEVYEYKDPVYFYIEK